MNTRQSLVFTSLMNTVHILERPEFDRPELTALRAKLVKAAKDVADLRFEQEVRNKHTGLDGGRIKVLRIELRKQLLRLSHNAVVTLEGLPGIEEDVRVPHANEKNAELLEATARILKNLRPHLKTLYRNGISRESITRIETTAKALKAKLADGDTAIVRRSRATSSIPDAIRKARLVVRALDDTIRLEFPGDQQMQFLWQDAKRVPRKLGRPKKRKPPEGPES
jgi:hypothetical protein